MFLIKWQIVLLTLVIMIAPAKTLATTNISRLNIKISGGTLVTTKSSNIIEKQILVSDHLSSTKGIIKENGKMSVALKYFAYGKSIDQNTVKIDQNNRYYTNQRKIDDDSDLYNYNARYYNPDTSVFIQPDVQEGPARYTYVSGNPIMANDPSGKEANYQAIPREYFMDGTLKPTIKYNSLKQIDPLFFKKDISRLNQIAWRHITKNPYDPNVQPYAFSKYLMEDINNTYTYYPENLEVLKNQFEIVKEKERFVKENSNMNPILLDILSASYKLPDRMANRIIDLVQSINFTTRSIPENIEGNSMVCSTFAQLTSYAYAMGGIPNEYLTIIEKDHAVVLIQVNKVVYVVDSLNNQIVSANGYEMQQFDRFQLWDRSLVTAIPQSTSGPFIRHLAYFVNSSLTSLPRY